MKKIKLGVFVGPLGRLGLLGGLMGHLGLLGGPRGLRGLSGLRGLKVPSGFAALLLVLAGCGAESPVELGGQPETPGVTELQKTISFGERLFEEEGQFAGSREARDAASRGSLTRATSLHTQSETFKVWGYKNMDCDPSNAANFTSYQQVIPGFLVQWIENSAFTTTSNTNGWEYVGIAADQTIKYWDFSAQAYRFFGVTPGSGGWPSGYFSGASGATETSGESGATGSYVFEATVDAGHIDDAPYFSELWFSTGQLPTYAARQFGQPVQLSFLRPFARVRFIFTFADGLTFGREALSEIKFYPSVNNPADNDPSNDVTIPTAGKVTVSYPLSGTSIAATWQTSNVTSGVTYFDIDYYTTPDPAVTPADALPTTYPNTVEKWYTVLPTLSQPDYTIEVKVLNGDLQSATVPAEYLSWKAGYEYTYRFKITEGGGIKLDIIQVGIDQWADGYNLTHTIYNW